MYDRCVFGLGAHTDRRDRLTHSTLFQTLYYRRVAGLPEYLVVVWHDSHADCQCLDLSRMKNGDCPVVVHDPEKKGAKRVQDVAPNFGKWLRDIVAQQLKLKRLLDLEMPGKLTPMGEFRRRKTAKKRKV